jgi:hypothetical protein
MNKILAWLPALFVLGAVAYKPVKEATQPTLVNKNISFTVYKNSSYSSVVYNNTSAQVHIVVEKINDKGQRTKVWDRMLDAKCLSQYPSAENALQQKITIPNVNEKKERIIVYYTLTYNSKGSELQMQEGMVVRDNNTSKINISI